MTKENIKLSKQIFESEEAKSSLDRDFNEFSPKKYTVKDFFKLYNSLFYDIPKSGTPPSNLTAPILLTVTDDDEGTIYPDPSPGPNGEDPLEGFYVKDASSDSTRKYWVSTLNTHKEIIEKSKQQAGSPSSDLDNQIESAQLILDNILSQIENIPKVHPFFENGSILEQRTEPFTKYYMVDGKTRPIYSSTAYGALKGSMGIKLPLANGIESNITIKMSIEGIEAIGSHSKGPIYSVEDLFI